MQTRSLPLAAYLLPLAFCFLPFLSHAQVEDADLLFKELRSMEGTWFMPTDRGDRLEYWTVMDDSTMTGREMRIRIENGDTVNLNELRLEWRGQDITYFLIPRGAGKKPIPFKLTTINDEGAYVFENPANDDPFKIRYLLLGNREMQVTTEGRRTSGGRPTITEYVFEREFAPGSVEFRLRAGANYFTQRKTGQFNTENGPALSGRVGWELGTQVRFKTRGGFLTLNFDVGLIGKFTHAKSAFFAVEKNVMGLDSFVDYQRDATYGQTWLLAAFTPEISFKRDGRFTVLAGPYYGILLGNRLHGTEIPAGDNKLFKANKDFKKHDLGLLVGAQYRLNLTRKDLDGILGLRANLGLKNLDNLYSRACSEPNSPLCNGQIFLQGLSLSYSVNMTKF